MGGCSICVTIRARFHSEGERGVAHLRPSECEILQGQCQIEWVSLRPVVGSFRRYIAAVFSLCFEAMLSIARYRVGRSGDRLRPCWGDVRKKVTMTNSTSHARQNCAMLCIPPVRRQPSRHHEQTRLRERSSPLPDATSPKIVDAISASPDLTFCSGRVQARPRQAQSNEARRKQRHE